MPKAALVSVFLLVLVKYGINISSQVENVAADDFIQFAVAVSFHRMYALKYAEGLGPEVAQLRRAIIKFWPLCSNSEAM